MWLAEALGERLPDEGYAGATDVLGDLAWMADFDMLRARADGDLARAAALAEQSMEYAVAAVGLDDDFMHLWPPSVRAALEAGDHEAAERLLALVEDAPPALVTPSGCPAILPLMRGLVRIGRGDPPEAVEANLRRRSIALLDEFGAVTLRGQAEESIARWLLAEGRSTEAGAAFDSARATYTEIDARGWLARLTQPVQGRPGVGIPPQPGMTETK